MSLEPQTRMELLIACDVMAEACMFHGVAFRDPVARAFRRHGRQNVADGCHNIFSFEEISDKTMPPSRYALIVVPFCKTAGDVRLMIKRGLPAAMMQRLWSFMQNNTQSVELDGILQQLDVIFEW